MADVKRICALCGVNRTPLNKGGIYQFNDRRGTPLGLFGECCYGAIIEAVHESPRSYRRANWTNDNEIREKIFEVARKKLLTKR